ncbi:cyclin [Chloropicon primus]|uniref:Cyclin n=1 Tax=Chloropicon primus TaxID=1764295 RepID=A0A5B8MPQ5_9CHLO|nr:cyclin [Chloropicon primus]UPR00476.1 cyclin [Chloropicon primus]|mmetsp:Transcript_8486/g.24248  ORF Transcript_8486/g.24248 Transcript_8486/m.24248 type:complete len:263 (-) Transcript_8486:1238-2026(-)|eukprot:QDZ21262.1 cyclin [Chloropicon primus]
MSSGRKRDRFAFVVPKEYVEDSESRRDGVSREDEVMLRVYGSEIIQQAGQLLKLPQQACATAQVIFQRFYIKRSFVDFKVDFAAMAAVWLASKLEETPRALRWILQVFYRIERRRKGLPLTPLEYSDPIFSNWKANVTVAERYMLREFGFSIQVEHPHKLVLVLLSPQVLNASSKLTQEAWNLLNDSLRTTACVRFNPETVACAMILLASRRLGHLLPDNPPWWEMFNVSLEQMEECIGLVSRLYTLPKAESIPVWKDLSDD